MIFHLHQSLSLSWLCWPLIFLCVSNSFLWLSNTMPVPPALLFFQLQDLPLIRGTCLVASAFKWRCILVIRQGLLPLSMWDHFLCTTDLYTTKTWDSWSWILSWSVMCAVAWVENMKCQVLASSGLCFLLLEMQSLIFWIELWRVQWFEQEIEWIGSLMMESGFWCHSTPHWTFPLHRRRKMLSFY